MSNLEEWPSLKQAILLTPRMHKVRATCQSFLRVQGEPLSALNRHHQQGLIVHGTHENPSVPVPQQRQAEVTGLGDRAILSDWTAVGQLCLLAVVAWRHP